MTSHFVGAALTLFVAALLLPGTTAVQAQTTWYVDDDAPNDPGPGDPNVSDPDEEGSPEHPFDAIQEGIDASSDGDTVLVLDGTYTGTGNKDLDFHGKAITVRSANGPDNCIIDCEGDGRGFYFHSGETLTSGVEGFTIRNGNVSGNGGGIYCDGSGPTIADCAIVGNTAEFSGGGIYCEEGAPTITNCTITTNVASAGGGIDCYYCWKSNPTITDCRITGNTAYYNGGGISCCYHSGPTITKCVIAGNTAGSHGGGVDCYLCELASPTVTDCKITGNTATTGGGLRCNQWSNAWISNCTITGNTAYYSGGGLSCLEYSRPMIANCTIIGNTADYGGGVFCRYYSRPTIGNCTIASNSATNGNGLACDSHHQSQPSDVRLTNCILWDADPEIWNNDGSTISITYSDVMGGWPGSGNIDADPLFVDSDGPDDDPNTWEDNDYHLGAGSPCIDAACNGGVPPDYADLDEDSDTTEITPLDLDGEGRFFDDPDTPDTGCGFSAIVDIGAYEFGDTGPQPCPGDIDGDRDVDQSDLGILLAAWGNSDTCDLDCDGDIDQGDLGILLAHWGEGCP